MSHNWKRLICRNNKEGSWDSSGRHGGSRGFSGFSFAPEFDCSFHAGRSPLPPAPTPLLPLQCTLQVHWDQLKASLHKYQQAAGNYRSALNPGVTRVHTVQMTEAAATQICPRVELSLVFQCDLCQFSFQGPFCQSSHSYCTYA